MNIKKSPTLTPQPADQQSPATEQHAQHQIAPWSVFGESLGEVLANIRSWVYHSFHEDRLVKIAPGQRETRRLNMLRRWSTCLPGGICRAISYRCPQTTERRQYVVLQQVLDVDVPPSFLLLHEFTGGGTLVAFKLDSRGTVLHPIAEQILRDANQFLLVEFKATVASLLLTHFVFAVGCDRDPIVGPILTMLPHDPQWRGEQLGLLPAIQLAGIESPWGTRFNTRLVLKR